MIIPSIDLMDQQAVQLIGGKEKALDAGDPRPLATRFGRVGEIAVIDLDAALSQGSNADTIRDLLRLAPCRVGGGIRSVDAALLWLNAGARKVILGTAARPEILKQLPRERVIAALDAVHGEVVVEGWTEKTGHSVEERIEALRPYVGGFLITFVEREGRLQGIDLDQVARLVELAGDARVTVAGGVSTPEEVAAIDKLGADAQVGMALYTGRFDLADALAASLRSDRDDGLWTTVVTDPHGVALGLAYSNLESLRTALNDGVGAYHSRSRGGLWIKGKTSGATQTLLSVDMDCDRDALRFTVRQNGPGFCHLDTHNCWGADRGITALAQTLRGRLDHAPAGSYTRRLLDDPTLLRAKLIEEVHELMEATDPAHVAEECADVLYFALTAMTRGGASLEDVEAAFDRRALRVKRRRGDAKPQHLAAALAAEAPHADVAAQSAAPTTPSDSSS